MAAVQRRYVLWVTGFALVLIAGSLWWLAEPDESGERYGSQEAFAAFVEGWPTTGTGDAGAAERDAFVADATDEACGDPEECHLLLWGYEEDSDYDDDETEVELSALVAEPGDDEEEWDTVRVTSVTRTETETDSGTETETWVGDPRAVPVTVPTLSFTIDLKDAFLFPAGVENIGELRYSEEEEDVVEEELAVPDDADADRVRWIGDRDWWGSNRSAGIDPVIRYELDGETVYRTARNHRACVGEGESFCPIEFPSEEVLFSLRTVWEEHHEFDPFRGDELDLNDSITIDGSFDGLFTEDTTTSHGGVARMRLEKGESETETKNTEEITAYAIYYENGYPATLSAYQEIPPQQGARFGAGDGLERFTTVAVFGDPAMMTSTESQLDPLVPVAFHPSGEPPLAALRTETETENKEFTIYGPIDPDDWSPMAFTHLDEDGGPVATQWLGHTSLSP